MQTTTNYGYNVPENGDAADITKVSQNFVDIDSDLKEVADTINNTCSDLSEKIDAVGTKVDGVRTKVDSIQTSVEGLPTSLETDFTEVKNAISDVKTDVSSVKTEVNSVKTSVDEVKTSNESSFTDVKNAISGVSTKVEAVSGSYVLNSGVIKSIQRGTARNGSTISYNKVVISANLSTVNPQKCIVIADAGAYITSVSDIKNVDRKALYINDITEFTENRISFDVVNYSGTWLDPTVTWQVVEFY